MNSELDLAATIQNTHHHVYSKSEMLDFFKKHHDSLHIDIKQLSEESRLIFHIGNVPFTSTLEFVKTLEKVDDNWDGLIVTKDLHYVDIPMHNHDFYEIIYVSEGEIENEFKNGESYLFRKGEICFLDKRIYHTVRAKTDKTVTYNLIVSDGLKDMLHPFLLKRSLLDLYFSQQGSNDFLIIDTKENDRIQWILFNLIKEYLIDSSKCSLAVQGYFYLFLAEVENMMGERASSSVVQNNSKTFLAETTMTFLHSHYHNASISQLADMLHYNSDYLGRLLKKVMGKSFSTLLQDVRLERAQRLLDHNDFPIESVAEEVGYLSISSFHKAFKKKYGMTPGEYRRATPPVPSSK